MRPQITVVNHYNILNRVNHGGNQAIKGLYKGLSRFFDVNIIIFTDDEKYKDEVVLCAGVKIIPILIPNSLRDEQKKLLAKLFPHKRPDDAIAYIRLYHLNDELVETVRKIAEDSVIVVAEHVYTWKLIKQSCPEKHLWYRAHNVEYDYRDTANGKGWMPPDLMQEIYDFEKSCITQAELILTISQLEYERFAELYQLTDATKEKMININAGYDVSKINLIYPSKRSKINEKYQYTGIYIATGNQLTKNAAEICLEIARAFPKIQIVFMGSVSHFLKEMQLPENVLIKGMVDDEEKQYYLNHCDFALNPVQGGAGINIKILEFFAYGIPTLSTEHGVRGIAATPGEDFILLPEGVEGALGGMKKYLSMSLSKKDKMSKRASTLVREHYTWDSIANKIVNQAKKMYGVELTKERPVQNKTYNTTKKEMRDVAITKDMIVNCYRYILGREPEQEVNTEWFAKKFGNDFEKVREYFLFSNEFISKYKSYISGDSSGLNIISNELVKKLTNANYSFLLGEDIYRRFRFPFAAVKPGSKIVIYGGGVVGKIFLMQIERSSYCTVVAICDKNPGSTGIVETTVIKISDLAGMQHRAYDLIVIANEKRNIAREIREDLIMAGIPNEKIIWLDPANVM